MRTLFLLVLSLPAFSQTFFFPVDAGLRSHLKLTDAQADQLQRNIQELRQRQNAATARLSVVNNEIALETRKPAPNAMELGLRYREIETICREQEDPLRETHEKQMQVLNPEQRVSAAELTNVLKLAPLSVFAAGLFFLPPPPPPTGFLNLPIFNGSEFQGPPSFGFNVPADLVTYLELSASQLDRIRDAQRAYQRFYAASQQRGNQVNRELDAEFKLDLSAPQSLGDRYIELETLRREIAGKENELRSELQSILTPEQRIRTQSLDAARAQSSVAYSASSFLLMPPETPRPASNTLIVSNLRTVNTGGFLQSIYRTCGSIGVIRFGSLSDFGGPAINASMSTPHN